MIEVLRKIWRFAGKEQGNIRKSMVLGSLRHLHMFQSRPSMWWSVALVDGSTSAAPASAALILLPCQYSGRQS